MLTIEEIKKELDAGNEIYLECFDRVGAFYGLSLEKTKGKLEGLLRVKEIDWNDVHFESGEFIEESELKYFRIKRPSPTFDDLIDVAVKAVRDKVLHSMQIGENKRKGRFINFSQDGNSSNEAHYEGNTAPYAVIDWINSLYTETFVIEDIESLQKVKIDANGILANGSKFKVHRAHGQYSGKGKLYIEFESEVTNHASLEVLKGATVTQKRA